MLFCCLAATAPRAAAVPAVVIRCGHLLDVRAGRMLDRQTIVVRGKRIAAVGPSGSVPTPSEARVIDLGEQTVVPGLIDCHTHIVDDANEYDVAGPLKKSAAQMAYGAIPHARATLLAGFTTIRDVGTYRAFVDVALRDAIEAGYVVGPHIIPCGAYVTITGGAGAITGLAPDIQLPLELRYGEADGADQVRQRVRAIIRHGAGCIKVLATGAILTPGSQPGAQEMTFDELHAAVEEAGHAGLKVACHAHGAAGAKDAIRAGVASIEHGSLLDEEALQMMLARGTFLVPDIYNDEAIMSKPPGYLDEFLQKERDTALSQVHVMQRAMRMGVKIAFGTDAAVIPHGDNGRQFNSYVKAGMTPLAAIRTATTSAAELIGWSDRVGAIEPGKLADVIAVRADPLQDVRTLEAPTFVMKDGVVYVEPTARR
jgi:imidazolonepropionase-like amidohydrolase